MSTLDLNARLSEMDVSKLAVKLPSSDSCVPVSAHFPAPRNSGIDFVVQLPDYAIPSVNGRIEHMPAKRRRLCSGDVSHDPLNRSPQTRKFAQVELDFLPGSQTIYPPKSDQPFASFPSGGGFDSLVSTAGYIGVDKTYYIEKLDKMATYQYMFLRPQGWGKTTFLQTLSAYYDKNNEDKFDDMFGQLYIGKHPTACRNSYLVLLFNFSCIRTLGPMEETKADFDMTVQASLSNFLDRYKDFLGDVDPKSLPNDGGHALERVLKLVKKRNHEMFVGVDDFDAPANGCLFTGNPQHRETYGNVASLLKTRFFAIMKKYICLPIKKYWLTGLIPAFRDYFSPLLATWNISMTGSFHGLCGLTEDELKVITETYLASDFSAVQIKAALQNVKRSCRGFKFASNQTSPSIVKLYYPHQVFTHLWTMRTDSTIELGGIGHDPTRSIAGLNISTCLPLMTNAMYERHYILEGFGAEVVSDIGTDVEITWSMLYYFGVLTYGDSGRRLV
ncbi:DUF1703-domain-containing protein [Rickenella mellea]|uniref:DUF1703-domain-containing protein n=1 Tax=Rickenella mellea TaxID=50990 RepID=A0A4Y7Q780_9AGAM|nr:DUF1703-domain-containing protein [Rickenella mellea]